MYEFSRGEVSQLTGKADVIFYVDDVEIFAV